MARTSTVQPVNPPVRTAREIVAANERPKRTRKFPVRVVEEPPATGAAQFAALTDAEFLDCGEGAHLIAIKVHPETGDAIWREWGMDVVIESNILLAVANIVHQQAIGVLVGKLQTVGQTLTEPMTTTAQPPR